MIAWHSVLQHCISHVGGVVFMVGRPTRRRFLDKTEITSQTSLTFTLLEFYGTGLFVWTKLPTIDHRSGEFKLAAGHRVRRG